MPSESHVHVVSKANIADHTVLSASPTDLPPLQHDCCRMRVIIVSLTVNTQSYARMGTALAWWDAFPVPENLPEPYNDRTQYGICPAWGYAEVLDTKISGFEAGEIIWGFWPTSSLPVDLRLVPTEPIGHWIEKSDHRQTLMNFYQRYVIPDPKLRVQSLDSTKWEEMAREAQFYVALAGHMINANIYGRDPIHPLGFGDWTERDADLSSAVVIALSASGKTARGFIHGIVDHRDSDRGPLGLLAITSMENKNLIPEASFPTKTASYKESIDNESLRWIAAQRPSKIVIIDFGGRGNSLLDLLDALKTMFKDCEVSILGVGGAADLTTAVEVAAHGKKTMALDNRVQMNTSGVRDTAIERYGAKAHFDAAQKVWSSYMKSALVTDVKLEIRDGVAGDGGFEGGWTKLLEGKVPVDAGMAYRF